MVVIICRIPTQGNVNKWQILLTTFPRYFSDFPESL